MFIICMAFANSSHAYAKGITDIEEFNEQTGDAKYLGAQYRENYSLDIEKTGLLDSGKEIVNDIANVLFSGIRLLAFVVVSIFYFAMDFDVGALLKPQINAIQTSMMEGLFQPLFVLAFTGTSVLILKKMVRRDFIGIMQQFLKVIGIVVFSVLLMYQTSTVLSYATNITKSMSVKTLTGINSDMGVSNTKSFAAQAAGVLWVGMVHQPWVSLEFGNGISGTASKETIESFMKTKPGSDERKELVKKYMEDNPDASNFNKGKGGERIAFCIVYFIPFLIKSGIYLVVALVQLVFQVLAVFFLIMAPVVLLLALLPSYETVLPVWLRKLLETQLGILIITILMAMLIKIDTLLYTLSEQFGWFIVLILQTAIGVGLFLGRNKVLHAFSNIQRGATSPNYLKSQLMRSGNIYQGLENRINKSQRRSPGTSSRNEKSMNVHQIEAKEEVEKPVISKQEMRTEQEQRENPQTTPRRIIHTQLDSDTDLSGTDTTSRTTRRRPDSSTKENGTDAATDSMHGNNVISFHERKDQMERPRPTMQYMNANEKDTGSDVHASNQETPERPRMRLSDETQNTTNQGTGSRPETTRETTTSNYSDTSINQPIHTADDVTVKRPTLNASTGKLEPQTERKTNTVKQNPYKAENSNPTMSESSLGAMHMPHSSKEAFAEDTSSPSSMKPTSTRREVEKPFMMERERNLYEEESDQEEVKEKKEAIQRSNASTGRRSYRRETENAKMNQGSLEAVERRKTQRRK